MDDKIDYQGLFLWLADCEAATTQHLGGLKSASKSELKRHRQICASLVSALECGNYSEIRSRSLEEVLSRLKDSQEKKA